MKFNSLELQGKLNSEITNLVVLNDVDSTNTFIKSLQSKKILDLVVAEKQSAGRGRRGNVWDSPKIGNIYMSLRFAFSEKIPALSLVTGLIVKEAIQEEMKDILLETHRSITHNERLIFCWNNPETIYQSINDRDLKNSDYLVSPFFINFVSKA